MPASFLRVFCSKRRLAPFLVGLSRRLSDAGGLLAFEADKPIDNYPSFILGVEYPLTGRMALRGVASAEFAVGEGAIGVELLAGLPEGVLPLKVWRPVSLPGNVQGDLYFGFKAARSSAGAGRAVFLYRSENKWKEAPVELSGENREFYFYSTRVPYSTHYALGLKTGD